MNDKKQGVPKRIVLTLWTVFIWIFRSPTMLMLIVGFGLGYYGGWQAGKASALPRAIRAETALRDLQTEMARALESAALEQVRIRDEIRTQYEDQNTKLDALNLRVGDLRRGVRLCESTASSMSLPTPATGTGSSSNTGQPRDADEVLQELAAQIALKCDRTATQLNSLIAWIAETRNAQHIRKAAETP